MNQEEMMAIQEQVQVELEQIEKLQNNGIYRIEMLRAQLKSQDILVELGKEMLERMNLLVENLSRIANSLETKTSQLPAKPVKKSKKQQEFEDDEEDDEEDDGEDEGVDEDSEELFTPVPSSLPSSLFKAQPKAMPKAAPKTQPKAAPKTQPIVQLKV